MKRPSHTFIQGVLGRESVRDAVEAVATFGELPLSANLRAEEALRVAVEIAQAAGREIDETPDGGGYILASIAIAAVQTLDPEQDKLHLRHTLVSWFGPANVPDNLRFSWEGKGKKPGKTADTAIVIDGATMVGDPSAWREGLKDGPNVGRIEAIPEITPERGAELMQVQNTMSAVDAAVLDVADLYKALGRIEMGHFLQQVQDVVIAKSFVQIKNEKKYKHLTYRDENGNVKRFQTLEEFCERTFKKSYRRINELANNLHTLGADLYEAAENVGFKARDYAALKALPESEQEVVKTALAAESKEQVLDILQDLAARHQSERQAAKKQTEDMKADLDARDKLLADKTERLDKVSMDLEKLKSLPSNKREVLRLEQEQEAAKKLTVAVIEAQAAVNAFLAQLAAIKDAEVSVYTKDHADQTASWFCQQVQLALQENGIQADMAEIMLPEWMRGMAKESPVEA